LTWYFKRNISAVCQAQRLQCSVAVCRKQGGQPLSQAPQQADGAVQRCSVFHNGMFHNVHHNGNKIKFDPNLMQAWSTALRKHEIHKYVMGND